MGPVLIVLYPFMIFMFFMVKKGSGCPFQPVPLPLQGGEKMGGGSFPGRCPGLFSPAPLGRKSQLRETLAPTRLRSAVVTSQFPIGAEV